MPRSKPISIEPFAEQPQKRFINRETSWLEFNSRVLEEACNNKIPLLERVKFLSISASNLDEFYMVRVAGLKEQAKNHLDTSSIDGLLPTEQLQIIKEKSNHLVSEQELCWFDLQVQLRKYGIYVFTKHKLGKADKDYLEEYFLKNIFPALSPIAIDPAHPFPFIPNLNMAVVLQIIKGKKNNKFKAIVPIPGKLERFVRIENDRYDKYILIEDVIELFSQYLFPNVTVTDFGIIRVTRDSDLEIEDDAEDLVLNFESAVKRRKRGSVIRLEVNEELPAYLTDFVVQSLDVEPGDVVKHKYILDIRSIIELYNAPYPSLKFEPYNQRSPERINDFGGDCFAAVAAKDIVIHHPYETFSVVVSFLQQAARDPEVVAIKQTLYRTSSGSPIVEALVEAAENGKAVTVVLELKARFDEQANINWARNLERAGAQVIFGFVDLKTHAKVSSVIRREQGELKSYVHLGTGNYHPITAKLYSDISFFTCDPTICKDVSYLFNYLTGYSTSEDFQKLIVSPIHLRKKLMSLIDDEIKHAKSGGKGRIWAKMNALIDKKIIDKLYEASQAGVSIDLVVRGICGLRPGIEGFSDNIRVKSIIGRFLEHSRIICFGAGHDIPSKNAKVFISSADWMPRNFDRRVEVMIPIENTTVHEQIMSQIMTANLKDEKQSWNLRHDGSYDRLDYDENSFSAHEYFMKNPSLSGRGKALTKDERQKIYQLFKGK